MRCLCDVAKALPTSLIYGAAAPDRKSGLFLHVASFLVTSLIFNILRLVF